MSQSVAGVYDISYSSVSILRSLFSAIIENRLFEGAGQQSSAVASAENIEAALVAPLIDDRRQSETFSR